MLSQTSKPISSLTVDVEEYFHAANLEVCLPPRTWHKLESRVERSTKELLDIFDETDSKGTFFVLGTTARRHPSLIQEIAARGHEIASHGYGHRIVYTQSPKSFYRDIRKTKLLLEELTGNQILGYRAPNFSIVERCLWAYDELTKAGYSYDSSLYPVRHPRYGNIERSTEMEERFTANGKLIILPLSVVETTMLGNHIRLGVAGGGWWRMLPKAYIWWGLNRLKKITPLNCYLHPWEIDPGQPHCEDLSALSSFRHYFGLSGFANTVRSFLRDFGSTPLKSRLC